MDASENRAPLTTLKNFGRNRVWTSACYRPADERAVLEILSRHAREKIRALGSLHSWSDIATGADISLDLSLIDAVEPLAQGGKNLVRVGAGCRLQTLLDRLHAVSDRTLPTLGAIKRQTIAGAVSTGTHGSGRESFSHFVTRVRLAAFDSAGKPEIFEYTAGDELRAARCGLGCMGILLSVDLETMPKYRVAEVVRSRRNVAEILATYREWPLTQFVLFPHAWQWVSFERKPAGAAGRSPNAYFFRIWNCVTTDIFFHLGVIACTFLGVAAQKALMRLTPALLVKNVERVDDAEHVLTLGHHYFRHEEMEVFVKESDFADVVALVQTVVSIFAGSAMVPAEVEGRLRSSGLYDELERLRGSYAHAYPIVFRRVIPDDALVSMASSASEPSYSMSFFSYAAPRRRAPFYGLCSFLARALNRLFDARLHWGKHFPLQFADVARCYPEMEKFRRLCRSSDPNGAFRNAYTTRVLDLPPGTGD